MPPGLCAAWEKFCLGNFYLFVLFSDDQFCSFTAFIGKHMYIKTDDKQMTDRQTLHSDIESANPTGSFVNFSSELLMRLMKE